MMKILFVADPFTALHPKGDTSLAMLRECLKRGHAAFWSTAESVEYTRDHVSVHATPCEHFNEEDDFPEVEQPEFYDIEEFDAVLIRKDPPFDTGYVRLCWILALAETKVWMFNRPSLLLRYHEKLVPLEALALGFLKRSDVIPTYLGNSRGAEEFARELELKRIVSKPFLGFAGKGVERFGIEEFISTTSSPMAITREPLERADVVVQPYLEEIEKGDRRVFFLAGKQIGQFTRIPKEGSFVSNLAAGGSAAFEPLSKGQEAVLDRLGAFLKKSGIAFVGADLIGTKISEVNITSPTGVRTYQELTKKNLCEPIVNFIERSAEKYSR